MGMEEFKKKISYLFEESIKFIPIINNDYYMKFDELMSNLDWLLFILMKFFILLILCSSLIEAGHIFSWDI